MSDNKNIMIFIDSSQSLLENLKSQFFHTGAISNLTSKIFKSNGQDDMTLYKNFGNGREIRKLFTQISTQQNNRLAQLDDLKENDKRLEEFLIEDLDF